MPENGNLQRRRFLKRLAAGVGGVFAAIFGVPAAATVVDPALRARAGGWQDAGPESAIQEGAAIRFRYTVAAGWETRKKAGYLVREGDAIVAFSAVCTHLGCTIRFREEEHRFVCPCHGGEFSLAGAPVKPPVTQPLVRLETRLEKGRVLVKV